MRIAVVGSGISGLVCAHVLGPTHEVTLFEADDRLGGHANTVTVDDPTAGPLGIDTGFIVHNDRTYPNLGRLFDELGVATQSSEMSLSVTDRATGFTYRATNPATLLARPANAVDRRLWRMLLDVARFYRQARRFLADPDPALTIGDLLAEGRYSPAFVDLHLIPMGTATWSISTEDFLRYPAATLLRFLDNHGLLSVGDRPKWRTVVGGSRSYIDAIVRRFPGRIRTATPVHEVRRLRSGPGGAVLVSSTAGAEAFDAVILACHSDQAVKLLSDRSRAEDEILGAIAYQHNRAVLHTDTSVLPPARRAWAAWNCHVDSTAEPRIGLARLTYDLTILQRLPGSRRYLVTLNPPEPDRPLAGVLAEVDYAHPRFDHRAVEAQRRVESIDGVDGVSFCGAWRGYGFHEDGVRAALQVCRRFGATW